MKKMLLLSSIQHSAKLIKKAEQELKDRVITFISTASKVEKFGFLVNLEKWTLKRLGLIVDELDVTKSSYAIIKTKLEENDYIYVAGGNTFFLLQELKKTGADNILIQQVNDGKFYIAESAGAIIACPNIEYAAKMDNSEQAPLLTNYDGLNLVDFYVVPHFKSWELGKNAEEIIQEYDSILNLKAITDHQGILISGNERLILTK